MRIHPSRLIFISTLLALTNFTLYAGPRLARFANMFRSYKHTAVVEEEYPLSCPGSVTLKTVDGNITVRTEWRSSVHVKITKRAVNPSLLESVTLSKETTDNGRHLHLTASCSESGVAVDYTIIVPTQSNLCLKAAEGSIDVREISGSVVAQTKRGNIIIQDVSDSILAQTKERGDITIERAANVKAMTESGNITAHQIARSIAASTQDGDIDASMSKLPEAGSVALHVAPGRKARLELPQQQRHEKQTRPLELLTSSKNARSTLTADHYLVIRPQHIERNAPPSTILHAVQKLCRCGEAEPSFIQEKTAQFKSKFRQLLAQTGKYFYPSTWFTRRRDG